MRRTKSNEWKPKPAPQETPKKHSPPPVSQEKPVREKPKPKEPRNQADLVRRALAQQERPRSSSEPVQELVRKINSNCLSNNSGSSGSPYFWATSSLARVCTCWVYVVQMLQSCPVYFLSASYSSTRLQASSRKTRLFTSRDPRTQTSDSGQFSRRKRSSQTRLSTQFLSIRGAALRSLTA